MRQDFSRARRWAAALAILALAAAGCGRNSGSVPPDYAPTGTGGNNVLTVEMVNDTSGGQSNRFVRLRIYDHSQASGYGMYRRLPGQGYERVLHDPFRFDGSFNSGVETYEAIDNDWQPSRQVDYLARGDFGGIETEESPTTNTATLPASSDVDSLTAGHLVITCPISTPTFTAKVDSTPVLVWNPMPGAVRYLLHISRLDNHLFFYGFTPNDGSHSYVIGSGIGDIIHEDLLTQKSFYFWTVEGLDASSRIIGRSDKQSFEVRSIIQADSLVFCTP